MCVCVCVCTHTHTHIYLADETGCNSDIYIPTTAQTHSMFNLVSNFEVCHPHCVFKLKGEVNSVKKTTMNIWLNDGVY